MLYSFLKYYLIKFFLIDRIKFSSTQPKHLQYRQKMLQMACIDVKSFYLQMITFCYAEQYNQF